MKSFTDCAGTAIRRQLDAASSLLHPSTAPEAVAADQRRDVREFLTRHPLSSVEAIADGLDLPVDVTARRLAELSGTVLEIPKAIPTDRGLGAMKIGFFKPAAKESV